MMQESKTNQPRSTDSERSKSTLPGGYHSRGVPGEEGAVRNRMRVLKVGDRSQRIDSSQPLKGAAGAGQAAAARLDKAAREPDQARRQATFDQQAQPAQSSDPVDDPAAQTAFDETGAVFVIAKKGVESLDTPVFYAGDSGDEEAVSLFTSRRQAEQYLAAAGWTASDEVGSITSHELLEWLTTARGEGIHYVTINPERKQHLAGDPQTALALDELDEASAASLWQEITNLAR